MADDISLVVGVDYTELTGLIKTTDQTKRALSAVARQFAQTGDQRQYMKGINQLVAAQNKLPESSRLSRSEIMKLGAQMRQEEKFTESLTAATYGLRKAQMAATKSTSRMGIVTQQAGYQVSDFIVQVQSGTNPFVAFSQQASQLAGVLPLMADKLKMSAARLIGISSVLGIVIPLVGALGAAFLGTMRDVEESTEEAEKKTKTLSNTISSLNTIQKTTAKGFEEGLNKAFDSSAEAVGKLLSALRQAEFQATMKPIKDALDDMTVGVDKVDIALKSIVDLNRLEKAGATLSVQQKSLREDSQKLIEQNLLLALSYQDVEGALDKISKSKTTKELVTNFAEALALAENLSGPIGKELTEALLEAADEAEILDQIIKTSSQSAEELNDNLDETSERLTRIKGLMGEIASETTKVDEETIKLTKALGGSTEEAIAIQRALDSGKISASKLKGVDIDSALSPAAKSARKLAEDLGISLRTSLAMLGLIAKSEPVLDPRDPRFDEREARLQKLRDMMASGELYDSTSDDKTTSTKRDPLADLQKQVELEQALIGKTEARQRIIKALGVDFMKYGQDTVSSLENQINKTIELEEAEKRRQKTIEEAKRQQEQLKDSIESSMGDAFMSIIDGTKSVEDAFRDMARQIIAELMRVLVVKQMVSAATGFFGFADGGVFQGGSQVQAYANGGVVGGPTYFPMAGGKTGLMGEAGPEAIMPLKRGKDGKLGVTVDGGQQQSVVIHQSFNFAANGDDSVKRIIASEAPKIAKMTEAQILDNRRRGGQFRKAFA